MIALFGEKKRQIMGIFAGKCDRNADMCLLTCAQNKRYILGTNSEIRKSLQGIKEYGEI
jgi:hypothetical protein